MAGGSAVHRTTEALDLASLGITSDGPRTFNEALDQIIEETETKENVPHAEWKVSGRPSKEYPNGNDERWWRENGQAQVDNWVNWLKHSPYEILVLPSGEPAVELGFEIQAGGGPSKLFIDRILSTTEGKPVVVDLKTGSRKPGSYTQLGFYALAVREELKIPCYAGGYFMTRKGELVGPVDLGRYDRKAIDYTWKGVRTQIESGVFPASESELCPYCSVREYCYAWAGKSASEVSPYAA